MRNGAANTTSAKEIHPSVRVQYMIQLLVFLKATSQWLSWFERRKQKGKRYFFSLRHYRSQQQIVSGSASSCAFCLCLNLLVFTCDKPPHSHLFSSMFGLIQVHLSNEECVLSEIRNSGTICEIFCVLSLCKWILIHLQTVSILKIIHDQWDFTIIALSIQYNQGGNRNM